MVRAVPIAAAAASLLFLPSVFADGLYPKSSPVLNVDHRTYHSLLTRSNHTSIVEFYAPWCGHCQKLKPAYEKAAKSLEGLANVAAVNCDDEDNKPFCQQQGVQGFPTLRILRPGKKAGKPTVDEFKGQRTAKEIVDTVISTIPNNVKRLKDSDYAEWVAEGQSPKAILFSEKGIVSGLLKAVAIDFLDVLDVAQVRSNQKEAVETFAVDQFPSLILLPGGGKEPVTYDGVMKKEPIVSFLSQAATPHPDPVKDGKAPKKPAASKSKSSASATSSSSGEASPSKSANKGKPAQVADTVTPISSLLDGLSLQQKCLNDKAGTCILLLLPGANFATANTIHALKSLSEIHQKHSSSGRQLFPFYQLPATNSQAATLRTKLELSPAEAEIVAVNGKRGWWRRFTETDFTHNSVESWIDAIRMGDIPKLDLPQVVIANAADLPAEPVQVADDPELAQRKEALKQQMPEGLDFEFEEISDEDYEKLTKQSGQAAKQPAHERDEL